MSVQISFEIRSESSPKRVQIFSIPWLELCTVDLWEIARAVAVDMNGTCQVELSFVTMDHGWRHYGVQAYDNKTDMCCTVGPLLWKLGLRRRRGGLFRRRLRHDCWQHYTVSKKKINPTCFIIKWLNINRFKQYLQEIILNKKYVTFLWNTAKFCDFLSLVNWNRLSVSNRLWVIYEFEGFVPDQKWRQVNLPLEVAYCRKWKRIKKAY